MLRLRSQHDYWLKWFSTGIYFRINVNSLLYYCRRIPRQLYPFFPFPTKRNPTRKFPLAFSLSRGTFDLPFTCHLSKADDKKEFVITPTPRGTELGMAI